MSTVEKVALAIVGVALATTLVLPGRMTPQVLTAAGNVFSGGLRTAMGR
jgi:hypothetical protein